MRGFGAKRPITPLAARGAIAPTVRPDTLMQPELADRRRPSAGGTSRTARATVVIPCYNQSHFLGECLESVRAQTYPDWEAVVVDDASPDGDDIRRVVEELEDDRIRVVRHASNKGLGGSRNTGIRESRTELVLPLDADDRITPGCLEALVGALDADPELDCAYADVQLFGRTEEVLEFPGPPPGKPMLRAEHTIPGAGTMMRKALWERLGGYDEADVLRMGREDFEFWIRAFDTGCRSKRLTEPVYEYRILHASMNVNCRLQDHVIADYIYRKHKDLFDRTGEADNFLCFWLGKAARASYLRGLRWRAFTLALRAWKFDPRWSRLKQTCRSLLSYSTNEAINRGEIRRAIPFVGYPLKGEERHRPFFVIGMERSGNELVRRMLTSHPGLHMPPASPAIGPCIQKFKAYGRHMTWPDLVSLVMSEFQFHADFKRFELDVEPLVNRLRWVLPPERNLAHLFDALFRHHAEVHGRECVGWGDDTPQCSLDDVIVRGDEPKRIAVGVPQTLERLLDVFPDAQFLHVCRDGCDVVLALLRGGFFSSIEEAANRWLHVETQTRRFARRHASQSLEVRYEDLVGRPEEVARAVCDFLGVELEPGMLAPERDSHNLGAVPAWSWHARVGEPTDSETDEARRVFSLAEREELQRLIGPALERFGYAPATVDPPATTGPR